MKHFNSWLDPATGEEMEYFGTGICRIALAYSRFRWRHSESERKPWHSITSLESWHYSSIRYNPKSIVQLRIAAKRLSILSTEHPVAVVLFAFATTPGSPIDKEHIGSWKTAGEGLHIKRQTSGSAKTAMDVDLQQFSELCNHLCLKTHLDQMKFCNACATKRIYLWEIAYDCNHGLRQHSAWWAKAE